MRDTLDLKVLVSRGVAYRKLAIQFRWRTLALVIITAAILLMLGQFSRSFGTIYRGDGVVWESIELPGFPEDVQVAANGDVWVSTYDKAGLSRFDGAVWHHLDLTDVVGYGRHMIYFATWENEVWLAVGDRVSQYRDGKWIQHGDVLESDYPAAIAASDDLVVVMAFDGTMSQYDGETWTRDDTESVLPGIKRYDDAYPSIQTAPNGDIWLSYNGIWQWTDGMWNRVDLNSTRYEYEALYYELLLVDETYAWVSSQSLMTINLETGELYEKEFSLVENNYDVWYVESASRSGDTNYFATYNGILTYTDNVGWAFNSSTLTEEGHIMATAVDGTGQQWVAVVPLNPYGNNGIVVLADLGSLLVAIFAIMILIFGVLRPAATYSQLRLDRFNKVLHQTIPDLELQKPLIERSKLSANSFIQLIIVLLIVFFLTWQLGLSIGFSAVVFAGLWLTAYFFETGKSLNDDKITEHRKAVLRRNRAKTVILVSISALPLLIIFGNTESIIDVYGLLAFFLGIIFSYMIAMVIMWAILLIPYRRAIAGAFADGNYDQAFKELENLRPWFTSEMTYSALKAMIQLSAGQFEAAEGEIREQIANYQNLAPQHQVAGLINLGHALGGQDRHDEGLPILSAALQAAPDMMMGYGHLAVHYLQQEIELERAYELTTTMMQFERKSWLTQLTFGLGYADMLGIRAVSLAYMGQFEEAEGMMQRAFDEMDERLKPGMAILHFNAAQIKNLQEDKVTMIRHLKKAVALDPQGITGKKAQEALTELNADQS